MRAVVVVLSLSIAFGTPGAAQETVRARFRIDLTGPGEARVEAGYELRRAGGEGEGWVPLELLRFGGSRIVEATVRVGGDGTLRELELARARPRVLRDSVAVGPAARDSVVRLGLRYTVRSALENGGEDLRWRVPLLQAGGGAAEALPGTFSAEVILPAGVYPYESFPTGIRVSEGTGNSRTVHLSLQVVPAVVTLRARRGAAPLFPPLKLLDGGVVLLLLALGAVGWRYMARLEEAG